MHPLDRRLRSKKKIEAFLAELVALCARHGVALGGNFAVSPMDPDVPEDKQGVSLDAFSVEFIDAEGAHGGKWKPLETTAWARPRDRNTVAVHGLSGTVEEASLGPPLRTRCGRTCYPADRPTPEGTFELDTPECNRIEATFDPELITCRVCAARNLKPTR